MTYRILSAAAVFVQLFSIAEAQTNPTPTPIVDLPRGTMTRILSPDRKWTLIFECPNECSERKLWIEQKSTHTRRLVHEYERSLSISWAPDSSLFFVNDYSGSNVAACYLYDPLTLKETDLGDVVTVHDKGAEQYIKAGHSYLRVKRWINSHELLVTLSGHFDEPPARGFTRTYRVDVGGTVRKISERPEESP